VGDNPNHVPTLTQIWSGGRTVTGKDSDIVGWQAPTQQPDGSYVEQDGTPVDKDGNPLGPDGKPKKAPVSRNGSPTTARGDPLEPKTERLVVSPNAIKVAETTILNKTDLAVSDFETFKKDVRDKQSWIFWIDDPSELDPVWHSGGGNGKANTDSGSGGQPRGSYPDHTDPDPAGTQQIINGQEEMLRGIGDAIELYGRLVAQLNNAAQLYKKSDDESFPPTS
jgi:hypothetical protein